MALMPKEKISSPDGDPMGLWILFIGTYVKGYLLTGSVGDP